MRAQRSEGSDLSVLFDDRSARLERTTGWERYTREIARELSGDPRVTMGTGSAAGWPRRLLSDWVQIPARLGTVDVAHFPSFPPVPVPRRRERPALVYTLHDMTWWLYPETATRAGRYYYRRLAEVAVHRAAILLTDSHAARQDLLDRFDVPADKVRVVYPGVHLPPARQRTTSTGRPFLLTVGTVEPRKNIALLIAAFNRSGLARDVDLVVAGRRGWGSSPGVHVRANLTDAQLHDLYTSTLAVVTPSLYEGFGLPVVEALAHGAPVLCSDIPVFREVTGGRATFFDPTSVDDLTDALRSVVAGGITAPVGGREWAARFSWERTVAGCLRAYAAARGRQERAADSDGASEDDGVLP